MCGFEVLFLLVGKELGDEVLQRDHRLLLMDHTGSAQAVDALLSPLRAHTQNQLD